MYVPYAPACIHMTPSRIRMHPHTSICIICLPCASVQQYLAHVLKGNMDKKNQHVKLELRCEEKTGYESNPA